MDSQIPPPPRERARGALKLHKEGRGQLCASSTLTTGFTALLGLALSQAYSCFPYSYPKAGGPVQAWPYESSLLVALTAASLPLGSPGSGHEAGVISSRVSTFN